LIHPVNILFIKIIPFEKVVNESTLKYDIDIPLTSKNSPQEKTEPLDVQP